MKETNFSQFYSKKPRPTQMVMLMFSSQMKLLPQIETPLKFRLESDIISIYCNIINKNHQKDH